MIDFLGLILSYADWLILAVWSGIFLAIGFLCGWIYCNWRYAEGIMVQLDRELVRKVFRENGNDS